MAGLIFSWSKTLPFRIHRGVVPGNPTKTWRGRIVFDDGILDFMMYTPFGTWATISQTLFLLMKVSSKRNSRDGCTLCQLWGNNVVPKRLILRKITKLYFS